MLVRSAGFITLITSLMFSFMDGAAEQTRIVRFILLVSGVLMIWAISQSKPVERILNHLIEAALRRWTDLDTRDYASLLNLSGGFSVMELLVRHNDWLAGSRLQDLQLPREGIVVLGINRQDGKYDGVPSGNTVIKAGDRLIAYGQAAALRELDQRTGGEKGEAAHIAAVEQYEQSLHHKTDRMM
jgi:NhaP-type Na+/H+ and K+/H+ antiporter